MSDDTQPADEVYYTPDGMPTDTVCRICGQGITFANQDDARWAGSSTNPRAFLAHGKCWDAQPPRAEWKWPDDA